MVSGASLRVGARGRFYGMSVVELVCITLGESATFCAEKFLKNLPHLPQVPRSKLSGKRSSFGICGSLAILNLPRICRTCRICPRRDRFRDEPLEKRAKVYVVILVWVMLGG